MPRKEENVAGPAEGEMGGKPGGCETALAWVLSLGLLDFPILERM